MRSSNWSWALLVAATPALANPSAEGDSYGAPTTPPKYYGGEKSEEIYSSTPSVSYSIYLSPTFTSSETPIAHPSSTETPATYYSISPTSVAYSSTSKSSLAYPSGSGTPIGYTRSSFANSSPAFYRSKSTTVSPKIYPSKPSSSAPTPCSSTIIKSYEQSSSSAVSSFSPVSPGWNNLPSNPKSYSRPSSKIAPIQYPGSNGPFQSYGTSVVTSAPEKTRTLTTFQKSTEAIYQPASKNTLSSYADSQTLTSPTGVLNTPAPAPTCGALPTNTVTAVVSSEYTYTTTYLSTVPVTMTHTYGSGSISSHTDSSVTVITSILTSTLYQTQTFTLSYTSSTPTPSAYPPRPIPSASDYSVQKVGWGGAASYAANSGVPNAYTTVITTTSVSSATSTIQSSYLVESTMPSTYTGPVKTIVYSSKVTPRAYTTDIITYTSVSCPPHVTSYQTVSGPSTYTYTTLVSYSSSPVVTKTTTTEYVTVSCTPYTTTVPVNYMGPVPPTTSSSKPIYTTTDITTVIYSTSILSATCAIYTVNGTAITSTISNGPTVYAHSSPLVSPTATLSSSRRYSSVPVKSPSKPHNEYPHKSHGKAPLAYTSAGSSSSSLVESVSETIINYPSTESLGPYSTVFILSTTTVNPYKPSKAPSYTPVFSPSRYSIQPSSPSIYFKSTGSPKPSYAKPSSATSVQSIETPGQTPVDTSVGTPKTLVETPKTPVETPKTPQPTPQQNTTPSRTPTTPFSTPTPVPSNPPSSGHFCQRTKVPNCTPCEGQPDSNPDKFCGLTARDDYYEQWPKTCMKIVCNIRVQNMTISPDGVPRRSIVFNGQMPGPHIEGVWGDMMEVNVVNELADNGTSVHFHGLRQLGTNHMDGVPSITQCPIPGNGGSMTYKFQLTQYGTTWYHSHYSLQAWEGAIGPMTIYGPKHVDYDIEFGSVMLSDWLHTPVFSLFPSVQMTGAPVQDNVLINGKNVFVQPTGETVGSRSEFVFTPGKKHRLRIASGALDSYFAFSIDGHVLTVIATDLVPVVPFQTRVLNIGIGQRYDIIVEANQTPGDYWMRVDSLSAQFVPGPVPPCGAPSKMDGNTRAIIHYAGHSSTPTTTAVSHPNSCDEMPLSSLVPYLSKSVAAPDHFLTENVVIAQNPATQIFRWQLNSVPFQVEFGQPSLLSILERNNSFQNALAIDVPQAGKWIYVIIQSPVPLPHPIHMHGHDFYVLASGRGTFDMATMAGILNLANPPRRDVTLLPELGFVVLAFQTDNPGSWLMHCHIGWHVSMGFALQFIEQQDRILSDVLLPQVAQDLTGTCAAYNLFAAGGHIVENDSGV